jgi:hypothetical protein
VTLRNRMRRAREAVGRLGQDEAGPERGLDDDRPAAETRRHAGRLAMRANLVVGGPFPDLELPDHRRETVKLSKLANGFPLIVSFYRGYW